MQATFNRLPVAGVLLILTLCLPAVSNAQYAYDIEEAGYGLNSYARGLNNLGQVVGAFFDPASQNLHAYIYSNGQSHEIYPTPGVASGSGALGINDNGQIVTSYQEHGYIYDSRTGIRIGLSPNDISSSAVAINQSGVIVGRADFGQGVPGYLFDPSFGVAVKLGTIPGGNGSTTPTALNNHNDVVGSAGLISDSPYAAEQLRA